MSSLLEQEVELEAEIETYRAQLNAVKKKVSEAAPDVAAGMNQLLTDLQQLIELSEQNLMELKKHKLLLMLHEAPATCEGGQQQVPPSEEGGEQERLCQPSQDQEQDELVGMKCRVPLKESWGGESHHNAIVLCREPLPPTPPPPPDGEGPPVAGGPDEATPEEPGVRVLFTQPLYSAMKPCSFFLEANCKFSEQECKFSHGHVVPLSRLRPFQEPDYSVAHVGGRCLARHEDGLWYNAIISSVGEECVVYFPSLSLTSQLSQEHLLPLESSGESSSDEEGESEGEEEEVVVEWKPCASNAPLGQWEAHTTGIGSRLLAKMGYVVGQGLGKEGQGRVEPVEIVILPAGKSLDVCAQLREEKRVKVVDGLQKRRRRRKGKANKTSSARDEGPTDMFEFLNTKVFSRGTSAEQIMPVKKADSKSATSGNLNVKLFEVQEEVKAVLKRRKSLKESLSRHQRRKEKKLMEQVQEKLASVESHLEQLYRKEKIIERDITAKSDRKKLSVF